MSWQVIKTESYSDKVAVLFEHPDHPLKVRMLWNGAWRRFEWDGTGMKVEPKYHPELIRALRKAFRTTYF